MALYVDEIAVASSQLPGVDGIFSMQNIKNHAVFELILGKTAIAREQSVSIAVETEGLIEDLPIKNTDLCEVIGTFIDNAIEAVSTLNNRLVGIALINDDHHVSITISNCYEDRIHSLPKDRHRGHGLQYVEKILSLYPYILWHTSCSDGIYLQELIIPI